MNEKEEETSSIGSGQPSNNPIEKLKTAGEYFIGTILLLCGIGYLLIYTILGGGIIIASGIFFYPIVYNWIESQLKMDLHIFTRLGISGGLFVLGSMISLQYVDLSRAPDFVIGI